MNAAKENSKHTDWRCTRVQIGARPSDLTIPDKWASRLEFSTTDDGSYLHFRGVMSRRNRTELKALSTDRPFKAAIDQLYLDSRTFLNRGESFVSVFRWVLILLSAKLFEKIADGVFDVLTVQHPAKPILRISYAAPIWLHKIYDGASALVVGYGLQIDEVQRAYAIGFVQFVVTVLLLLRYFICVVDPVWRKTGITTHTDFANDAWRGRLAAVQVGTLVKVAAIASFEFFFLYHSARSIQKVDHWLHFLLLLVLADILLFLVPNFVRSLPRVGKLFGWLFIGMTLLLLYVLICLVVMVPLLLFCLVLLLVQTVVGFFKKRPPASEAEKGTSQPAAASEDGVLTPSHQTTVHANPWHRASVFHAWARERIQRPFGSVRTNFGVVLGILGAIWRDYFIWDLFDLAAICIGLYVWHRPASLVDENWWACMVVGGATVVISIANFYWNRDVYHAHLAVLKLGRT
ncbi:MAG: hypothetical protein QOH96_79 [Blastocatellia bacterium]|jgi:chromate transport protein ChrA|nr:hypothetical protein [Blastocatellia bacterium]